MAFLDKHGLVTLVEQIKTFVTSKITAANVSTQAQLATKVPTTRTINDKPLTADITLNATDLGFDGGVSNVLTTPFTKNRAIVSSEDGKIHTSDEVSKTELEYLKGATSNIQAQINAKADSGHEHSASDINDGILSVSYGGTGRNFFKEGSAIPTYAIIRASSDLEEHPYLHYTPTGNGAFYAEKENGAPKFGILPIDQGGTGTTTGAAAIASFTDNILQREDKEKDDGTVVKTVTADNMYITNLTAYKVVRSSSSSYNLSNADLGYDLNNCTELGACYLCSHTTLNSTENPIQNAPPYKYAGFRMFVERASANSRIVQIALFSSDSSRASQIWIRSLCIKDDGTNVWHPWEKVMTNLLTEGYDYGTKLPTTDLAPGRIFYLIPGDSELDNSASGDSSDAGDSSSNDSGGGGA